MDRYVHEAQLPPEPRDNDLFVWLVNSFFLIVALALFVVSAQMGIFKKQPKVVVQTIASVKGASTQGSFIPTPTITPTPMPTDVIDPTDAPIKLHKANYSLAIIGDSMVDTMGEQLDYLGRALKLKYPLNTFTLYNYGIGSQNVEDGLNRFGLEFHYKDRNYVSLSTLHPDILIVGSFGYNPFSPYDRDKHWLTLTHLIEEAKKTGSHVYVLAEIAPLIHDFGRGPNGVNWPDDLRETHAHQIIELLQNAVGLAKNEKVGLIDAFDHSVTNSSHEGRKQYVNPGDGIHPSVAGHEFTADEIVKAVQFN